jgi:hypothetical protein
MCEKFHADGRTLFKFLREANEWEDARISSKVFDDGFMISQEVLTTCVSGKKDSTKYSSFNDLLVAADGFMRDFEDE